MQLTHVLRADLNLVPALAALLEERHVSRASARLGLSQPATSRALQRLRSLLGDPLLIREPDGYRLTPRAEGLRAQLEDVLPALEALVGPESFDPASATLPINLASTDFAVHTYGAAICHRLLHESPLASVRFHSWRYDTMAEQIRRGSVDLGLYGEFAPSDLSSADLRNERFVCVVDIEHPCTTGQFTLTEYSRLRHLVVDVHDGAQPDVDNRLRLLGAERAAVVTVPYHAAVPQILAGSDLVATIPASLALRWPDTYPVRIIAAPSQIRRLAYRMVWHRAYDDDGRHRWLRSIVRAAVTEYAVSQSDR